MNTPLLVPHSLTRAHMCHQADFQDSLLRVLVQTILAGRPAIYATPQLAEVNKNGGDRINKKIQQILKKMLEANGVEDASGLVQDEVAKVGRSKKGPGGTPSPKKTPTKGKKRKMLEQGDEGQETEPENDSVKRESN